MPAPTTPTIAAALLALALGLAGCGADADAAPGYDGDDGRLAHAAHDPAGLATPSDLSLYHAASVWRDATGAERTLASLAGRVQVVTMLYTSCAYACPRLMLDMKRIEAELGDALAPDVGFVVVSIDPARDTPERLAGFAAGSRLDPGRWTLLAGDDDAVLELAALLGVRYRESAPGEFIHGNVLTVLDRRGEIVHRQEGLGADPAATLAAIRAAAR